MRTLLALALCSITTSTLAGEGRQADTANREQTAVLVELSRKSGLAAGDLSKILSDCDVNQQSMYFCAWRDQIGAGLALDRVLADQLQKFPACKDFMESRVANWARSSDASCVKSASRAFGNGSMKPTAQAMCMTAETLKMTKRMERLNGCSSS